MYYLNFFLVSELCKVSNVILNSNPLGPAFDLAVQTLGRLPAAHMGEFLPQASDCSFLPMGTLGGSSWRIWQRAGLHSYLPTVAKPSLLFRTFGECSDQRIVREKRNMHISKYIFKVINILVQILWLI